jgi:hypothetical protein
MPQFRWHLQLRVVRGQAAPSARIGRSSPSDAALLIRMSTGPFACSARGSSVSTASKSDRSTGTAEAPSSAALSASRVALRATTVTFAPRVIMDRAMCGPTPREPPVTTTCMPLMLTTAPPGV